MEKILDVLEYRFTFGVKNPSGFQDIAITLNDLQQNHIRLEELGDALRSLAANHPVTIKKFWVLHYRNKERPIEPPELDVKYHTLARLEVSLDFKTLAKKIRESLNIPIEKVRLVDCEISFDARTSSLLVNGTPCPLPPHKNEADLCEVIFREPVGAAISWENVAAYMTGLDTRRLDVKKHMPPVRDAMYNLNERVQKKYGTKDRLISWRNKALCRNY
ncbi:MAG: hypothetical protein AAB804_01815 [Patescibacteria group bacterium]